MNPASVDIKDRLVSQSVGTFATDLFIGIMPESPDACVSIRDMTGPPPELRYELDYPSIQILIRGAKGAYPTAFAKAQAVHNALHGVVNTTINLTRYLLISAAHSPAYLGDDSLNRPLFSINFDVQRTTA